MSDIKVIRPEVKNMTPHIERKNIATQIVNDVIPTNITKPDAVERAKKAGKKAHSEVSDIKRKISMEIVGENWESEFDFIEEACGSGAPIFEWYDTPHAITESKDEKISGHSYIGKASGVFAPIGVMSRNNRIYEDDHYPYLLENQALVEKIKHRGMLGTIGHHNKKVDDEDLAEGKVSHVVTELYVKEEADGTRNLYGTLEILDTPAGILLKKYYDANLPLFVSSRGGGKLYQRPNESFKRVDKTKYFLETFDIVKNPGFLQAKPVYERVTEEVENGQISEELHTPEDFKVSAVLHKSISEEELAIADYEKRSAKCREHGHILLAELFSELAEDERVHAAQLREIIKILHLDNAEKEVEGKAEAHELAKEIAKEREERIAKITKLFNRFEKIAESLDMSEEAPVEVEAEEKDVKTDKAEADKDGDKEKKGEDVSKPTKYEEQPEDHVATNDEENDEEEDNVASSVTEEVEPLGKLGKKASDKLEKKLADDAKAGQGNIISVLVPDKDQRTATMINPGQAQANKSKAMKAKLTRDYNAKHGNKKPVEDKTEQLSLFGNKEALAESLKNDYKEERKEPVSFSDLAWTEVKDRLKKDYKEKDGRIKPVAFSDLAWADAKDRLKKNYKENK